VFCCVAFGVICSAGNKKLIGSCGGVECILQAMKAHPTIPSVQEEACWALRNLSANDGELIFGIIDECMQFD
jgi:hypothetical protein